MAKQQFRKRGSADDLFPDFPVERGRLNEEGNRFISPGLTKDGPPEQKRLPDLDSMKELSMTELQGVLDHYGVGVPWQSMKNELTGYVGRMTEMTDPEAIQREVERLTDPNGPMARRHMLGMARRVDQTWSMLEAADGDINAEFMWMSEFDDSLCEGCEGNAGDIASLSEWYETGLPGPAVCYGGNYCRCDLVRVEGGELGETPSIDYGMLTRLSVDELQAKRPALPSQRRQLSRPRSTDKIELSDEQAKADQLARYVGNDVRKLDILTDTEKRQVMQWNWVHGPNRKISVATKEAIKKEFDSKSVVRNIRNFNIPNKQVKSLQKDVRATYDETQKSLKKEGVKTVRLYRGVKTDVDTPGVVESWTTDVNTAKRFGKNVMVRDVPAELIYNYRGSPTWIDGIWGNQKEYMVLGE